MKKVLILILVSILLITTFSIVNASTSSKVELKASTDKVKAGDTFTVDVVATAEYNITGISSLIAYDKEKVSLEKTEELNGFKHMGSKDKLDAALFEINGETLKSVKIYTLTFKVLDNIVADEISITLNSIRLALINDSKQQVNSTADNASIKLEVEGKAVASNSNVSLNVNPDKVKAGDTFKVDVIANGEYNVTGISSVLTYDKTKLSLEKTEELNGFKHMGSKDKLEAALFDGEISKSVKIYTLTFKVLENVSAGDISISLSDIELALVNNNKEQIDAKAADANAKITVIIEEPKPEDPKPEEPKPEDPKPEDPKPEDPKPGDNAQRADFSNAKIEFIQDGGANNVQRLKISNVNLVEDCGYYIYMSHNKDENVVVTDTNDLNDVKWNYFYGDIIYLTSEQYEVIETSGDIYVWVCEVSNRIPKMVINAKKIDRIKPMPLGTRLKAYFFDDYTSTFCWEFYRGENKKINVKIGTVTDKSILKSIKNGEADCLQKLLNYAKSANSIYTGTVKLGKDKTITDSMNLIDDAYYYVYMELEDENGKYYPVEDVSLYQALVSESVGKNLFNYLDDNFVWNLEEDENPGTQEPKPEDDNSTVDKNQNTKLPQTGAESVSIIVMAVLAVAAVIFYKSYRRYNDI